MGVLKVKSGGLWVPVGMSMQAGTPVGYVGHDITGGSIGITTALTELGSRVTWTAQPTRRYKTTLLTGGITKDATLGHIQAHISNATGGGTILLTRFLYLIANGVGYVMMTLVETGLSGSQTRNAMAQTSATGATVGAGTLMLVEDITPASQPAGAGTWQAFTPQLDQLPNVNIAKTVRHSRYCQVGKTVTWVFNVRCDGAGTAGGQIRLSLPVPAIAGVQALTGVGAMYDASASTRYVCTLEYATANMIGWAVNGVSTDLLGASPSLALANGDSVNGQLTYEAA